MTRDSKLDAICSRSSRILDRINEGHAGEEELTAHAGDLAVSVIELAELVRELNNGLQAVGSHPALV